MTDPQDHQSYRNDIDFLFSLTSGHLAEIMAHIQQTRGNFPPGMFIPFYRGFHNLFIQTSKSEIMQSEKDLINEIDTWMDFMNPVNLERVKKGRELFRRWGEAMERQGLHTFTKQG